MISNDELLDRDLGPIGTPERDKYEIRFFMLKIGRRIARKRKQLGLSQEDLAERTEINVREIKRMERTAIRIPMPVIHRVWNELGINFNGEIFYDVPNFSLKPKSSVKKKLTKQSSSFRTLAR